MMREEKVWVRGGGGGGGVQKCKDENRSIVHYLDALNSMYKWDSLSMLGCFLFGFLTSSSTTMLYRGRAELHCICRHKDTSVVGVTAKVKSPSAALDKSVV